MGMLSRYVVGSLYLNLKMLLRYKSTLFWVVVFPILFLGLMTLIFTPREGEDRFTLLVVNQDKGEGESWLSETLVSVLNSSGVFRVEPAGDIDVVEKAVSNGTANVGLLIPRGFTENVTHLSQVSVTVYERRSQPGVPSPAAQALLGVLSVFEERVRERTVEVMVNFVPPQQRGEAEAGLRFLANPLEVRDVELTPPLLYTRGGVIAYYALSVVGIQVLFIGLSMGATVQIERKRDGTLKILLSSPLSPGSLFIADVVDLFFFTGISTASVLLAGLLMGANYGLLDAGEWAAILALALVGALFSSSLGLLLSLRTRTVEGASMLVNAVAFPTMFLGGLTVPKELLPRWSQAFAEVFPLTRLIDAMRSLTVYGNGLSDTLYYALPGIAASLALAVAGWLTYRRLLQAAVESG